MKTLSLFIPVKNEIESLPQVRQTVESFSNWISERNLHLDVFIHDNGSSDGSWEFIENWAETKHLRAFKLQRDIGYQESLALAFDNAIGDAFLILQSDLQDPIEIAMEMVEYWLQGKSAIVGIPSMRKESLAEKIGRRIFVFLFKQSSDLRDHEWFTDFYLIDRKIYETFRGLPLVNQFIRGRLLEEVKFDEVIKYVRRDRKTGKSSFNFTRRYNLAISALLLHSSRSIRKLIVASVLIGAVSVIASAILFILASTNILSSDKIGLYGISLLILINANIMTILFGIVLEYLARLHTRLHLPDAVISRKNLYSKTINL